MREPQAILFDIGGTLWEELEFDPHRGTEQVLALASENPNGTTADEVLARLEEFERDLFERRESAWLEISPYAVHRLVYEPAGVRFARPFEAIELAFWRAAMRVVPIHGAVQAVRNAAGCGIPLAVVSNSTFTSRTLEWQLGEIGLGELFEFVISSGDYVVRKPHPLIFQTAARKLGFEPRDIWHVGDSLVFYVAGAASAGMQAIWFDAVGEKAPGDHIVVRSWAAFTDVLARTSRGPTA